MSLAPAVHPDIRGVEGKARPVETTCCVPGCISLSQQGHHMWSRSFLRGQPYDWVKLPSGRVISNVVGLCMRHHNAVTGEIGGHGSMIRLESDETFIWLDVERDYDVPGVQTNWIHRGLLHPQPHSETPVEKPVEPVEKPPLSAAHSHPDLEPGEQCGSCGYTRPLPKEPGAKRPSKTYTLIVPDDAEVGADVLDDWIEQFAVILGFGSDVSQRLVRYHVMVAVLAWAGMHRAEFIADIKEAAA
jgi:hypothetical protein